MPGENAKREFIALGRLGRDPRINRPVHERDVRKLLSEFDPDKMPDLVVIKRADGSYVIADGQHRREVLLALMNGDERQKVPCRVHTGLDQDGELRLVRACSTTKQRTAVERFIEAADLGEEPQFAVRTILANRGLKVSPSPGDVSCPTALMAAHKAGVLAAVLDGLGQLTEDTGWLSANVVHALTDVFKAFDAPAIATVRKALTGRYGRDAPERDHRRGVAAFLHDAAEKRIDDRSKSTRKAITQVVREAIAERVPATQQT